MVRHFIIISTNGKIRIALDIVEKGDDYTNHIGEIISKIMKKCNGEVMLSTRSILADGEGWEAVGKADAYFKNTELIKDDEEFINRMMANKELKELDIKKYILLKARCTLSEVNQIYDACRFNYACKTRKRLAEDGVVDVAYDNYELELVYANRSRWHYNCLVPLILYAKDGLRKLETINATISGFRRKVCSDFLERMYGLYGK